MPRDRRGVALLEVLVALAVLGTAGLALVGLVSEGLASVVDSQAREEALADQERLLVAHALLARVDLDRRLGHRVIGAYFVDVQRPERGLYRVAVGDRERPTVETLVTVVYREGGP